MIDREINEFVRIISSLSLNQSRKESIAKYLIQKNNERKETSTKYVAAASAVAFLAVGTFLVARGIKQDVNVI